MTVASPATLVEFLRASQMLTPGQLAEVDQTLLARCPDARALARELLGRGWLTAYQANLLLQGRGGELLLGPYLLLERLGEGGMGQVFKARHLVMDRPVALKIIRKDRLASPLALERFQQEVRAAGKLSHPNVVIAHHADRVGDTHFLVMEYVEGTDLAKLLQQRGPLPAAEACEYVRQAALGLQHAHERGLVHRDVKPSNLLVSRPEAVVKVLDLGLARVRACLGEEATPDRLTQEGAVMGTPDYIAPEQAVDAAGADIRADIYSLGCTFYHLLTGRPPFPAGSLTQKLLLHQQREPEPAENFRSDLPPGLTGVLRKMLAKRPEDRYQTPGEVAAALEPFARPGSVPTLPVAIPVASRGPTPAPPAALPVPTQGSTVDRVLSHSRSTVGDTPVPVLPVPARGNRWLLPLCLGGLLLLGAGITLGILLANRGSPSQEGERAHTASPDGGNNSNARPPQDKREAVQPPAEEEPPPPAGPLGPARLVHEMKGHTGPVQCLAFSPSGKVLASGADDQRVRLWDVKTGEERDVVLKHDNPVRALAWSGDGRLLASGSWGGYNNAVRLWDGSTGRPLRTLVWKEKTGTPSRAEVRSLAFGPGGRLLAAGGGPVQLWDLEKKGDPTLLEWQQVFPSYLYGLAFSPDGKLLAGGCHETGDKVLCWTLPSPGEPEVLVGNGMAFGLGHADYRSAVAFAPDGKLLARVTSKRSHPAQGGAGSLMTWDVAAGGKKITLRDSFEVPAGRVYALKVCRGGRLLVAVARGVSELPAVFETGVPEGEIHVWDSDTQKVQVIRTGHRKGITALAFSPGGRLLASGSQDQSIRLWDLAGGSKK